MSSELYYILGVMGLSWLMIIAAIAFMPYYTRKSIAFGVAVPKNMYDYEFFASLRQQYMWANLVLGAVLMFASTLAILRLPEDPAAYVGVGLIFLYVVLSFILYARAYNKVRAFKRKSDWEISTVASAQVLKYSDDRKLFNLWWYVTYLVLIGATIAVSLIVYPSLPELIPQQYSMTGEVNTYAQKSMGFILSLPLTQLAMAALFVGIGWGINRAKRQTDAVNVEHGLRSNRTFQIAMGKMMFWLGLAMQLILSVSQLSILELLPPQFVLWGTFALLAFVIVVVVYVTLAIGQGGYRLEERQAAKDESLSRDTSQDEVAGDDKHWVFYGTFYNNPDDPSVFVEKRVGVGWTTNIGSPIGRALMIGAAVLLVGLIVALPFLAMLD